MPWSTEQLERLARENARVGFRPGDLLPASAYAELDEPTAYLALLATVPDGAGAAGYIEALRRYAAAHPLDERAT